MKNLYALLLLLITFPSFAQDSTFTVTITNGLDYRFNIQKSDNDMIERVIYSPVVPSPENPVAFTIQFTDDDYVSYIEFDDYNFDGYPDMYMHDPCMILGNCHGKVYIFDSMQFKHDPRFDYMTTVTADPEGKTIFSSNRSSAGSIFTNETFKWEGDELILIKRVSQGFAPGDDGKVYLHKTEERDENGVLKVIEEKYLKEPLLH